MVPVAACVPATCQLHQHRSSLTSIADVIAKYRQEIPQQMKQNNIPGLAIAVVDDQGILWEESFGYTDWDNQTTGYAFHPFLDPIHVQILHRYSRHVRRPGWIG